MQMMSKIAWVSFALSVISAPVSAEATEDEVAVELYQQVSQCWVGIDDLDRPWELSVSVKVTIASDGRLIGDPVITTPANSFPQTDALKAARDRAYHAVTKCAPYSLPSNSIVWPKEVDFHFIPPPVETGV